MCALLLAVTGCADAARYEWRKAGVDEGRLTADKGGCRATARDRAEREFERDIYRGGRSGADDRVDARSLEYARAQHDAARYRERLYEECLRSLGYEKVRTRPDQGT